RIHLDTPRARTGRETPCVPAIRSPADRVGRRHVGEGKHTLEIEMVLTVALRAIRLREPVIHVESIACRDPLHHPVEDDPAVLGLVEAEVAEVVEHASRLREYRGVDPGAFPPRRL